MGIRHVVPYFWNMSQVCDFILLLCGGSRYVIHTGDHIGRTTTLVTRKRIQFCAMSR